MVVSDFPRPQQCRIFFIPKGNPRKNSFLVQVAEFQFTLTLFRTVLRLYFNVVLDDVTNLADESSTDCAQSAVLIKPLDIVFDAPDRVSMRTVSC